MTEFQSKFNGRDARHRHAMLGILLMLAREIANGPDGMKFRQEPFEGAKHNGWIPNAWRSKQRALVSLVDQAQQGFGYVLRGNVKVQYYLALKPKTKKKVSE